jgi:hypothetical protein
MKIQTFYRMAVWLPLVLPGSLAILRYCFGFSFVPSPIRPIVGGLLGSLLYGGIPYFALAVWATWRLGGLDETQIKRLMVKAPFLMIGAFTIFMFIAGFRVGRPEFIFLGPIASVLIIPTGYAYIGAVLLLREYLGERLH